jgi:hypothetical protein
MAIVMMARVPGMTAELYDRGIASIQEKLAGAIPPGARLHVASPIDDGFFVVEVWDTREQFNSYFEKYVLPEMAKMSLDGVPDVTFFEAISNFDE